MDSEGKSRQPGIAVSSVDRARTPSCTRYVCVRGSRETDQRGSKGANITRDSRGAWCARETKGEEDAKSSQSQVANYRERGARRDATDSQPRAIRVRERERSSLGPARQALGYGDPLALIGRMTQGGEHVGAIAASKVAYRPRRGSVREG